MEQFSQAIKSRLSIHSLLLALVLIASCFTRFYRLPSFLTFLGDEGRDVTIVRRMIKELHPALIGPQTSIGNMYLGPLYYYLMVIPLLLANFSPVGPALFIAILGVVTVGFLYFVANELFANRNLALLAAFLYSISPPVITYSRSSWNPNIMPFFSLLSVFLMWRVWTQRQYKLLPLIGISFAFVIQSHYLGLLLLPVLIIFFLATLRRAQHQTATLVKQAILSFVIFIALMSPLVFFDIRHEYRNFKAMKSFFTVRQETVNLKPTRALPKLIPILNSFSSTMLGISGLAYLVLLSIVVGVYNKETRKSTIFLGIWLATGILGLGLYKQTIYTHYYGFIFPVPFLLLSLLLGLVSKKNIGKIISFSILCLVLFSFAKENPLLKSPNYQLSRTQAVSDYIFEVSGGNKFNLALIAKRNYDAGYRYFLAQNGSNIALIQDDLTPQLFVVCEEPICEPINNPIAEIANFGWAKIDKHWVFPWGTQLFRLVHTK